VLGAEGEQGNRMLRGASVRGAAKPRIGNMRGIATGAVSGSVRAKGESVCGFAARGSEVFSFHFFLECW